jgi:hypothetical protein
MKIDIHITDATPEEASLVLAGVTVSQAVGRVAARIVQKKAEERTADPTCVEETGCEGCQNTEFDAHTCEECSPPPAPIAPVLKRKYNKSASEKRTKPVEAPSAGVGKYGIPKKLFGTDKALYQRLWNRCKKLGIKYEAALAMEAKMRKRPGKKPDTPKPSAKAIAPSNDVKESPAQERCKDGTLPALAVKEKIKAATATIAASKLRHGQKVKHNGPHSSPFYGKTGEIMDIAADGKIRVQFGESSTWLQPYIVMAIPGAGA